MLIIAISQQFFNWNELELVSVSTNNSALQRVKGEQILNLLDFVKIWA